MSLSELIAAKVNSLNGVKATQLASDPELVQACLAVEKETGKEVDLIGLLDEMVWSGDLVEVEYAVPERPDRIKSLYFPKGTQVYTNATNETLRQIKEALESSANETLRKIKEALESAEDYDVVYYIAELVGADIKAN